jgi:crossover junction endodeoxyribonuclease RusA
LTTGLHWSREWYQAHQTKGGPPASSTRPPEAPALLGPVPKPCFNLVLPWPPSVNHSHAGDHHLAPETRAFRRQVANLAMVGRIRPLSGRRLALSVVAFAPDRRRRDLGNLEKQISDALQHAGLIADDFDFDRIELARVWDHPERGTVHVTVVQL